MEDQKMKKYLIMLYIFIGFIVGIMFTQYYIINNLEVDGINEGYQGQVVLKLNDKYYEYYYNLINIENK